MATDPNLTYSDATRKARAHRGVQPRLLDDAQDDDLEVEALQPDEAPPVTPTPAPQERRKIIGTTGGEVPQQAGTWDKPPLSVADLSDDLTVRRQQIIDETNRRKKAAFERNRPFAPSTWAKDANEREVRQVGREIAADYADYRQQQRAAAIEERRRQRFEQKTRNADLESQYRSTGQQFYTDAFGNILPIVEAESGRQLYHETAWEPGRHPKDGRPVKVKRDKYGQRQFKNYPLITSDDPMDDKLYWKDPDGEERYPAMTIDEAIKSPDISVAKRGLAARKAKMSAERREAIVNMELLHDSVNMQFQSQAALAIAKREQARQMAEAGAKPEEVARYDDEAQAIEDSIKPGSGQLWVQQQIASKALMVEKIKAKRDAYALQREERMAHIIESGGDPATDKLLLENDRFLQTYEDQLKQAESAEKEIERLMQPEQPRPAQAPEATTGQKVATAAANIAEGAGTGLVDMGEAAVRNLRRAGEAGPLTALMGPAGAAIRFAGKLLPGEALTDEMATEMRKAAAEWGPDLSPEIKKQLEDSFVTGTAPKALGSALAFMAPSGAAGAAARAIGMTGKALAGVVTATVAALGAGASGNAFRREAEAALRKQLQAGEITQPEFEQSLGFAEAFGSLLGTTEAVPLSRFVQRMGGTIAGKTFIGKMLEKFARGGESGATKWLKTEGVDALSEAIEEGGQEFVQSIGQDLYASQTFDPGREIGKSSAEQAAVGGFVGALLSVLSRVLRVRGGPAVPHGEPPVIEPPAGGAQPAPEPVAAPVAQEAVAPAQNFPVEDLTPAERAQAELEQALAQNVAPEETPATAGTTAEPADVQPQEAPAAPVETPVAPPAAEPVPVGEVAPINTPEAQPEQGAAIPPPPVEPVRVATDDEAAIEEAAQAQQAAPAPLAVKQGENGVEARVFPSTDPKTPGTFNVVLVDADSGETIATRVKVPSMEAADKVADTLLKGPAKTEAQPTAQASAAAIAKPSKPQESFQSPKPWFPPATRDKIIGITKRLSDLRGWRNQAGENALDSADPGFNSIISELAYKLGYRKTSTDFYDEKDFLHRVFTDAGLKERSAQETGSGRWLAANQTDKALADAINDIIQPQPTEAPDALRQPSPAQVLQREPNRPVEAGGERGRVEQVQQGTEAPREGEAQGAAPVSQVDERKNKIAKIRELQAQAKVYSDKGSLTVDEAKKFNRLMSEANNLRFDITKPVTEKDVGLPEQRQSTLPASIVVKAHQDLMRNKSVYMPIIESAIGVSHNADTAVDDVMNGKNPNVTPTQLYDAFSTTRDAMRAHYGPTVTLYRAKTKQKQKATTNWATTKEFAQGFGSDIESKQVPVEDIIAVNVGPNGKYHEVIVGKPPSAPAPVPVAEKPAPAPVEPKAEAPAPEAPKPVSPAKGGRVREAAKAMVTQMGRPTFDVWNMAGPSMKPVRQKVMSTLLGRKATVAESGVNAIVKEMAKQLGVPANAINVEDALKAMESAPAEAAAAPAPKGESKETAPSADFDAQETASGTTYQYRIAKEEGKWTGQVRIVSKGGTASAWESGIGVGKHNDRAKAAKRFADRFPQAASTSTDADIKAAHQENVAEKAATQKKADEQAAAQKAADEAHAAFRAAVAAVELPKGSNKEVTLVAKKDDKEETRKVTGMVYGDWVIHKNERNVPSEKYIISHIPSGLRATSAPTLAQAKEVIQGFMLSGVDSSKADIKSDKDALNKLIQTLNGLKTTQTPKWFNAGTTSPAPVKKPERAPKAAEPAQPEAPASPAVAPAPVETPKGQEVTPTPAQEKKVAKLADKKQLRVQKEFLVDAVKKSREEAPEQDAPTLDKEGQSVVDKVKAIHAEYSAIREKLKISDGEGHRINEEAAKEKLAPFVEKYTDLRDVPGSSMQTIDGGVQEYPGYQWRTMPLHSIEQILANAIRNVHGEHVRIEVPGDGTFRVPNTKLHLEKFAEMAAKRFGKGISPLAPGQYKAPAPTPIPSVKKKPSPNDVTNAVGLSKSDDETRKALNTVVQDGKWTIATDGRRITLALGGDGVKLGKDRTFKVGKEDVHYPNYEMVIPREFIERTPTGLKVNTKAQANINAEVDTAELLKLALIARTATSEKSNSIKIVQLPDGSIGFAAAAPDFGSYASEGVPEAGELGETRKITALNQFYLIDALTQARELGAEKIRIIAKDERSPVIFTDGKTFVNVTMPVRLSSLTDEGAPAIVDGLEEGRAVISRWQSANPKAPKEVTVVNDPKWTENGRGVLGQFADGKLTINLAYAPDEASIVSVANHEWAHDTLSTPNGKVALATFATRELPKADLDALLKKYPRQPGETIPDHRLRIVEEWVAKNVEKAPGLWTRMVEAVRRWLSRQGLVTLNNAEAARAMLRVLREQSGGGPRGGGSRFSLGTRTDTPEFKKWFGDSQVVDEDGIPRVLYHGTAATGIDTFKGDRGVAGHFAFDPTEAENYATSRYDDAMESGIEPDGGARESIYPVFLRANNLFDARNPDHVAKLNLPKSYDFVPSFDHLERNLRRIKKAGFDGYYDFEGNPKSPSGIAVFEPTQIKSATGNIGTFDPNNPDIRSSLTDEDEGPSFGIKNAATEEQRAMWDLPPPRERQGTTFEEARAEAKARFDADPFIGQKLVAELAGNPRPLTAVENMILDHEVVRLHNERNAADRIFAKAADSGDAQAMQLATDRIMSAQAAFEATMDVAEEVGTKSSESLYLRKAMLKEDYSLAALTRKMKQAQGGKDLTKAQEDEVRRLHEEYQRTLKDLEAKLEKTENERAKAVFEVELLKIIKGVEAEPKRQRNVEADNRYFETQAAAAEKRLAGKKTYDPADLNSYAIFAANILHKAQPKTVAKSALTEESVSSYPPDFEQAMIAKFGESVRPHLKEIYERAQLAVPLIESQVPGSRDIKGERKTTKERIKARVEDGDTVTDLGPYVQKLAEQFVREGITQRDPLINAVHRELTSLGLEVTKRETMDAISGYGKFAPLDQDEVKTKLRDLRGQMQQVGKLEDMAKGKAPAKTGVERRTPSDEERRLIQQVEEAKRKGGFRVTDPAKQLKSALDAIKTRLRNSIADLDYQIATGKQILQQKTGTPYDTEALTLKARREELKKQYDEMFGQSNLTDAQKLAIAEKAADRQIEELERQLRTNELYAKTKAQPLTSPTLEAKRARIAALKEEREYARHLIQPRAEPRSAEEISLQAYKASLTKRIAELQDRLARGDFAPRAKPPERVLDAEALRLKAIHEKAKTDVMRAIIHERMKNMTTAQKVYAGIKETMNLPRVAMSSWDVSAVLRQGGFIAMGNPKRAMESVGPMFRALASEEQSNIIEQEILNRPNAPIYKRSKLYIAPHEVLTMSAMEEQTMSRFAKYLPGVKHSNRAYITFLNKLRADSFDAMYETMSPEQRKNPKNLEAIANYINVATGRGNLGKASSAAEILATVLFSPRLLASRFQLLFGTPMMRGDKETRKMIAKEYVRFLTGLAVVLGLGAMAGAEIERDMRSSDFLKLRFGNTRIDPLGGLGQAITFLNRTLRGETKTAKGEIKSIRGPVEYGAQDTTDVLVNFIRSKLSPSLGAAINLNQGETVTGDEVTATSQLKNMILPLSLQDIYEAMQAQGPAAGSAMAALALFGYGLQQYGADIEDISPEVRRALNDAGLSAPVPDRPQVGPPNKKRWATDAEYERYRKDVGVRLNSLLAGRREMLKTLPRPKAQEMVSKMMEISRKTAKDKLDRTAR